MNQNLREYGVFISMIAKAAQITMFRDKILKFIESKNSISNAR